MDYTGTFGSRIRLARETAGLSQQGLARIINSNQTTISDWELGRMVPPDMIVLIAHATNDPMLIHEYATSVELAVLNIPYLNNVDDHTMTVLTTLRKEMCEAIDAIDTLTNLFRNKRSRGAFDEYEWEYALKQVKQVADVKPGLDVYFVSMAKKFDLDLKKLSEELTMKYIQRNYIK